MSVLVEDPIPDVKIDELNVYHNSIEPNNIQKQEKDQGEGNFIQDLGHSQCQVRFPSPNEIALYQILSKCEDFKCKGGSYLCPPYNKDFNIEEFKEMGWPLPIFMTKAPNPYTIPKDLLMFNPSEKQKFIQFFTGTPKEVKIRQIFSHTPLSNDEEISLQKLRNYCKSYNINTPPLIEPLLLRSLTYNKRKHPSDYLAKTSEHIVHMIEWRKATFPIRDDEENLKADLNSGAMYWVGRDSSYRPLLVVNVSRMARGENFLSRFIRLCLFCFEWGLRNLMIPGKVETCVVLLDVRNVAIHNLPINALSELVLVLTKQYPFRLNRMWVIHDSLFIQMLWGIAKAFLSDIQQQKIKILKTGFQEALLEDYHPGQIETHYGGKCPKHSVFYPFPMAKGPFTAIPKKDSKKSKHGIKSNEVYEKKESFCDEVYSEEIDLWKCSDFITSYGVSWEGDCRLPTLWSVEAPMIISENLIQSAFEVLKTDPTAAEYSPVVLKWLGKTPIMESKFETLKATSGLNVSGSREVFKRSSSSKEQRSRKNSFVEIQRSFTTMLSRIGSGESPNISKVRNEAQGPESLDVSHDSESKEQYSNIQGDFKCKIKSSTRRGHLFDLCKCVRSTSKAKSKS